MATFSKFQCLLCELFLIAANTDYCSYWVYERRYIYIYIEFETIANCLPCVHPINLLYLIIVPNHLHDHCIINTSYPIPEMIAFNPN